MARTRLDEADGLIVADVTHSRFKALPVSATVGEVQDWFAASESRHMALFALATPARRVPVVDGEGRLVGIVAVTHDLQAFCGTDDG